MNVCVPDANELAQGLEIAFAFEPHSPEILSMDSAVVLEYFEAKGVVDHYAKAAAELGLWISEERILTRLFDPKDSLLELGTGAGRIAFGLYELGYRHVMATDYSKSMIKQAKALAKLLEYPIPMHVANATQLSYEDGVYDGVIFGFNGLMQIPGATNREQALVEIRRVIKTSGWFVFTSHDRERSSHQSFWTEESERWAHGEQRGDLDDFGDRAESTRDGIHFMHVPTRSEMEAMLDRTGWRLEATVMRSELAQEPKAVEDFSDDCRFWVVQKT